MRSERQRCGVSVADARGSGEVTINAGGHVHYQGLTRPAGWTEIVRKAGSVGVLACADPILDDPPSRDDLKALAEQGELLAGAGLLQRSTTLSAGAPTP